ncbi:hypothetical protein [Aureivirga marina]|uniref:hypothetical protein n=1 Tax=Aureivirga marina TaxID=1182451 RepID=UPI0018CBD4A6|nr:hypothetical protein [Aureivirga marina]
MKTIKLFTKFFLVILLVTSCTKEEDVNLATNKTLDSRKIDFYPTVLNGILKFDDEIQLGSFVDHLKTLDDDSISEIMYGYYDQNFTPLFPYFHLEDDKNIQPWLEEKSLRVSNGKEIEQDDDLVNDENVASILTVKREVIIGNKYYRFTPIGLLFSDLEYKNEIDELVYSAGFNTTEDYDGYNIERGVIQISNHISAFSPLYLSKLDEPCFEPTKVTAPITANDISTPSDFFISLPCLSAGGSGSSNSSNNAHTETLLDKAEELRNIQPCEQSYVGIFGVRRVCFAYHSDHLRAKTIFFNENYYFYKSIGLKVKSQKKYGVLGWHRKKANEIAIVADQIYFAIEAPDQIPDYQNLTSDSRLYYYGDKLYNEDDMMYNVYIGQTLPSERIPATPFTNDIIVHEITNLPLVGQVGNITLEANELNEKFWTYVWDNAEALMNKLGEGKKAVTYIYQTPQKIYIQHVDITKRETNARWLTYRLSSDWGFQIKFSMAFNADGSVTTNYDDWDDIGTYINSIQLPPLNEFSDIYINFMGMTRDGDNWAGSRIVYKE